MKHQWSWSCCHSWLGGTSIEHQWTTVQRPRPWNPTLGSVVGVRGDRGAAIPYLRFVEVNLQIPGIRGYNKDVLLLAIPTTAYAEGVLVVVGSKIINRALGCMTAGELACATVTSSFWSSHVRVTAAMPQQLRETKMENSSRRMTLWRCRSTSWMVLKVLFTPHGRSQSHLFKL